MKKGLEKMEYICTWSTNGNEQEPEIWQPKGQNQWIDVRWITEIQRSELDILTGEGYVLQGIVQAYDEDDISIHT